MEFLESEIHSFIVKIWLEERAEDTGEPAWRGHITHVSDNRRLYFQDLAEINVFILPYLRQMDLNSEGRR